MGVGNAGLKSQDVCSDERSVDATTEETPGSHQVDDGPRKSFARASERNYLGRVGKFGTSVSGTRSPSSGGDGTDFLVGTMS